MRKKAVSSGPSPPLTSINLQFFGLTVSTGRDLLMNKNDKDVAKLITAAVLCALQHFGCDTLLQDRPSPHLGWKFLYLGPNSGWLESSN